MENNKISVILTHYNQWNFITEALDSVFSQTYKNIEIIITDDGSEKFDEKYLTDYFKEKNFTNFQIIRNEKNIGTVKTVLNALKNCSGGFISMFASDDKYADADFLEKCKNAFEDGKINVVSSKMLICEDTFDKVRFEFPTDEKIKEINSKSAKEQLSDLATGTIVGIGATVFRAKEIKKKFYLNSDNKYIEDWELFLKLALKGNAVHILENTTGMCHRGGGISENKHLPKEMKLSYLRDFENIFSKYIFAKSRNFSPDTLRRIIDFYGIFDNFYDIKLPEMSEHIEYITKNKENIANGTLVLQKDSPAEFICRLTDNYFFKMLFSIILSGVILSLFCDGIICCLLSPVSALVIYFLLKYFNRFLKGLNG